MTLQWKNLMTNTAAATQAEFTLAVEFMLTVRTLMCFHENSALPLWSLSVFVCLSVFLFLSTTDTSQIMTQTSGKSHWRGILQNSRQGHL